MRIALWLATLAFVSPALAQPVETARGATHTVAVAPGETLLITFSNRRYDPAMSTYGPAEVRVTGPDGALVAPPADGDFAPETWSLGRELAIRVDAAAPGAWTVLIEGEPSDEDAIEVELVSTDAPPPLTLFEAVERGDHDALQAAIAAADFVDVEDEGYRTPLMHAASRGDAEAVRLLLAAGADATATVGSQRRANWSWAMTEETALHAAAAAGHVSVIGLLLAAGAGVDAANIDGGTPLHSAVWGAEPDAVRALLAAGADPAPESDSGTPADLAAERIANAWTSEADRAALREILTLLGE